MYGACQKRQSNGDVDGCGQYVEVSDRKICEACGCHRSFHVVANTITTPVSSPQASLASLALLSSSLPRMDNTSIPAATPHVPASIASTGSDSSTGKSLPHPASSSLTQSFPEFPDGDLLIEIDAHVDDDYGYSGWATRAYSFWKLKGEQTVRPEN